jgi:hypothetical protein
MVHNHDTSQMRPNADLNEGFMMRESLWSLCIQDSQFRRLEEPM